MERMRLLLQCSERRTHGRGQSSYGWKMVAPEKVTAGEILRLLARQLKVRCSYLFLSREGTEVDKKYVITKGEALSLRLTRHVEVMEKMRSKESV